MAFWTLLVLGAFGFIYLVTDYHQTITEQVLVLLGIAAATALGSVAIDSRKSSTVDAELDRLAPERARVQAELDQIRERIPDLDANIGELLKQYTALNRALTPAEQEALDSQKELLRQEKIAEAGKAAELKRIDDQNALNESQLIKPVSEGFWRDLITDKDGVTLHRSQILVWTIALGAFFIWQVWEHLTMPAFSTELLALLGISSGTYLGFKFPEKQS
jgi:hypothetical protein